MSRIGKLAVPVPAGTTVSIVGQTVKAKGVKGELSLVLPEIITPTLQDNAVSVMPRADLTKQAEERIAAEVALGRRAPTFAQTLDRDARAQWGTARACVAAMVEGVSVGFKKNLKLEGVGYRAAMQGKDLKLALGFSHDVIYKAPAGITIESPKQDEIIISGADKQAVGQVAAEIRKFRPPEPFNGKGVRYLGEYVRRKEGKKK
jgi:large subunit ribosomal protein L6